MGRASFPRTLLGVLATLGLVAGLASCQSFSSTTSGPTAEVAAKPPTYKLVSVKEASLGTTLSYSGDVKPKSQAAVTAKMVGRIEQINVDVGSEVKAGDVIAVLEHSTIDAQVNQAETALLVAKARLAQMEAGPRQETVAQAEANLDSMKQKLASGNAGPRTEAVAQAEANLRQAEAKLAQLQAGPTPEQIEVAKTNIRLAKNQLYSIQTQADAYRVAAGRGAPPFTEGMKEAQSGVGYEQVQLAEAQLAALMAKAQPEVIAQAQAGVEAARQQLNLVKNPLTEWDLAQLQDAVQVAEEQVKLARSPYTAQDLEVARAQVKQAQAAIDLANTQVADSVVTAPFDGVVSDRFLTAGSLAAPASPIVNLISSDLEISLSVEEARSGMLKVGQPATVQVGAYPGQNFEGTISSIAPTVDPKTRTLVAKISVKDDQKQLKAGMYARVNIAAGQKQTGLLVPKDSVVKRGERDVVFTVVDGKAKMLEVQVGPTDGTNVQLLKGINAGEMIIQSPGSALQDGDVVAQ